MSVKHRFYCECGKEYIEDSMEGRQCECGNDCYLDLSNKSVNFIPFVPYLNESYGVYVKTAADHRKFVKEHGAPIGDYKKITDRMKFTRKNREDIIHDRYAKIGLKYPKGENVRLDEKNMRFVHQHA